MIKTLNPYPTTTTSKTAEILSRYRPIAPRLDTTSPSVDHDLTTTSAMSHKMIRQSPYLRNLWPQPQARPTRTRKRGRASPLLPLHPSLKRHRTTQHHVLTLSSSSPPTHVVTSLSFPVISCNLDHNLDNNKNTGSSSLVILPLLPCSSEITNTDCVEPKGKPKGIAIDLNETLEIPEEKDLLQQLKRPLKSIISTIITPQPVRPIGSSITVGCINLNPNSSLVRVPKKSEEVEEELEVEALPAVITDSNNRVRLANSAYKEMVGQPECPWLDFNTGSSTTSCKRICGEVMIHFSGDLRVPASYSSSSVSDGFSCWVRIEWERDEKRKCANALCDVVRLCCESKDYLFSWRFYTSSVAREREAKVL